MMQCEKLPRFLDRELPKGEMEAFHRHLEGCLACAEASRRWQFVADFVDEWSESEEQNAPETSRAIEHKIVAGFGKGAGSSRTGVRIALAAAAAILIAATTWLWLAAPEEETVGYEQVAAPSPTAPPSVNMRFVDADGVQESAYTRGKPIVAPEGKRVVLTAGADRLGLSEGGEIEVLSLVPDVVIELKRERVVAEVEPASDRGRFIVRAGAVEVRVVGTVFAVERVGQDEVNVTVTVLEGEVGVSRHSHDLGQLRSGETMRIVGRERWVEPVAPSTEAEIRSLLSERWTVPEVQSDSSPEVSQEGDKKSPKPAKLPGDGIPAPGLDELEQWIIGGRLETAQEALNHFLRAHRNDTRAWSLLADCMYRAGNWKGAVEAHREVIALAPERKANTARFRVGVILQDKLGAHQEAIDVFEAFYNSGGAHPLKAASLLRRARSHSAIGQQVEAEMLLKTLLSDYPGTTSAMEARRLLGE